VDEFHCRFCGDPVLPAAEGTYLLVEGWVPVRRGSGANTIRARSEPRGFAHNYCLDSAIHGGYQQVGLFDEEAR
jgi:hypothetical protein